MLDTRGFFPDTRPNQSLFNIGEQLQRYGERKQELAYRKEKEAEADEWRKLNLIQDLTDLSKHQTSSDVANAIGNQKAAEVLQKYTEAAKKMSGAELQANVSREMSGLIGGMDAMKNELDLSEQTLKLLKQQYPGIDVGRLATDSRADILKRRMDANLNFVNPMTVPPPSMDLSDPEFLADYITGNKNLTNAIVNPQGADQESVLMGKQGDYTKFEGKLPFWKKRSYNPEEYKDTGFYTGKEIPSFQFKSETIPTDALPASNGRPFEVVDKDVYERFAQDGNANLELIAATKKAFPNYNNFNPQEKEYAKRNVLLGQLKTLDQNQLHPTSNVRPQKTSVHVNTGSNKNAGADWVTRAMGALKKGDTQTTTDIFSELIAGDITKLESVEDLGGGKVKVRILPKPKYDIMGQAIQKSTEPVEKIFDVNSRTLPYELQNLYQTVMGGDVKLEKTYFPPNASKTNTPPPKDDKRPPLGSFIKQK